MMWGISQDQVDLLTRIHGENTPEDRAAALQQFETEAVEGRAKQMLYSPVGVEDPFFSQVHNAHEGLRGNFDDFAPAMRGYGVQQLADAGLGSYLDEVYGAGQWEKDFNTRLYNYANSDFGRNYRYVGESGNDLSYLQAVRDLLAARGDVDPTIMSGLDTMFTDLSSGYSTLSDQIKAQKDAQFKGQLMTAASLLGGVAFSPMALGQASLLGPIGSQLAGAAFNTGLSAIGGGNPLTAALGGLAPIGFNQIGGAGALQGMFGSFAPAVQSVGQNAVGQLLSGDEIDWRKLGFSAAGAGLDWGWDQIGGLDGVTGMLGDAAPATGYMSNVDLGSFEDMAPAPTGMRMFGSDAPVEAAGSVFDEIDTEPMALRMSYDIAPRSATPADIPEAPQEPLALQMTDLPGVDGIARSFYLGEYNAPSMPAPSMPAPTAAEEPAAEEPVEQMQQFDPEAIGSEWEAAPTELGEEAKSPFANIKPSTVLKLATMLGGLLGGDAAGDEARAVYEAEYANDEARRQAYLDYSNRILAAIPEIADAYDPDAYREIGQFGTVEIDPETGEARFVPTAEGQQSIDDLINAADKVIDQILDTDTSKLSAEEFQKAMTELQGKRDQDFAKLMRVLYARGMLGLATYGEAFDNPFTGRTESYQLEEGQAANPYLAALQSGVERENAELAGLSMNKAEDFIDQLLGKSTDLTGKLGARSGNMLDAILGARGRYGDMVKGGQARGNALAQLLQSPAGMFGGDASAALAAEDYMSEEERKRLLAMLEGE